MTYDEIRQHLEQIPATHEWPELLELADEMGPTTARLPFWEYPLVACRAGGTDPALALPAAAAVLCLVVAIRLVDDVLDDDPGGPHRELGAGRTANLALAFQAIASLVIEAGDLAPEAETEAHRVVAEISLATALGQHLDVEEPAGAGGETAEEIYWRIVEAKTPPLLRGALVLGGLHAGLGTEALDGLRDLGRVLGTIVQINDDLADAMESERASDWDRPGGNLAILYASEADHPERERFREILDEVGDPELLEEAQGILVRSGAVSYCAYRLAERYRAGRRLLERLEIPDPVPLRELLDRQIAPLEALFSRAGIDDAEGLFQ